MSFNYWPVTPAGGVVPPGTNPVAVDPGVNPLPVDLPVVGGGNTKVKSATKHGTGNDYAVVTGSTTAGQLAAWDASGNLVSVAAPYDIVCSLAGKPGAAAVVLIFVAVRAVALPANLTASKGSVGTNPTATAAYDVKNNGTTIATVSISTSGVFTFTTASGTAKALAAGDRLTIIAPSSQDATLSDVGFTLAGTR
jgi:hypothetical protein